MTGTIATLRVVLLKLLLLLATIGAFSVQAQLQGFYVGTSIGIEDAKARYTKSVINSVDFIESPRAGQEFQSDTSAEDNKFHYGVLVGYRFDLNEDQLFLAFQVEAALRGDELDGILPGSGDGDGLNERGENWDEDLSFETVSDIGLLAKVGMVQRFLVVDLSVYALAGLRQTKMEVAAEFTGCAESLDCVDNLQETFRNTESPEFRQWTFGVGAEKTIGSKSALQFELRYTTSNKEKWNLEGFEHLTIPYSLENSTYDVSAKLVRYLF